MKMEANADLEAFAKEREVKQEANSSKNRMEEQTLVEQIEGELEEGGNPWERVMKFVDLQVGQGHPPSCVRSRDQPVVRATESLDSLTLDTVPLTDGALRCLPRH